MIRRNTPRAHWLAALAIPLLLTACGTGGTDPVSDTVVEDPQPVEVLHPSRVLIRPAEDEDINEIVDAIGGTVVKRVDGTDFYVVQRPTNESVEDYLDDVRGDVRVLDSERDRIVSGPEGGGATTPIGSELFPFSVVPTQPELVRIGAPIASTRATGLGVRIAVIDTGVVATHVAMQGHIEPGGWDFVDNDSDPTDEMNGIDDDDDELIDEGFGHGTFVSSLVLAVAGDATIVPYRVLNSDCTGLASHVAQAITMATDAGVDAINLSLGMEHRSVVIGEAIVYARDRNVLVIASAGNTGAEEVTFPATINVAFSITSVDPTDVKPEFASYGSDVDLAAPGDWLFGAYPVEDDVAVQWSGTSFSAALVTGTVALVRELNPSWNHGQIVQFIKNTSDDIDQENPGFEGALGEGRLNLDAATQPPPGG